ncbi:hypothetical protein AWI16_11895 [Enterobacter ludwigii]|nr:hypothetical protein AWI16_11895 [Enterobacter ludwigii]
MEAAVYLLALRLHLMQQQQVALLDVIRALGLMCQPETSQLPWVQEAWAARVAIMEVGGLSSFGTQVSAGGGYGGTFMPADSVLAIVVAAASTQPGGTLPIGGNVNSSTDTTQYNFDVRLSGSVANSGSGGCSLLDNGGGGARASGTATATFNGGKGGGGVVIVWEFS